MLIPLFCHAHSPLLQGPSQDSFAVNGLLSEYPWPLNSHSTPNTSLVSSHLEVTTWLHAVECNAYVLESVSIV